MFLPGRPASLVGVEPVVDPAEQVDLLAIGQSRGRGGVSRGGVPSHGPLPARFRCLAPTAARLGLVVLVRQRQVGQKPRDGEPRLA